MLGLGSQCEEKAGDNLSTAKKKGGGGNYVPKPLHSLFNKSPRNRVCLRKLGRQLLHLKWHLERAWLFVWGKPLGLAKVATGLCWESGFGTWQSYFSSFRSRNQTGGGRLVNVCPYICGSHRQAHCRIQDAHRLASYWGKWYAGNQHPCGTSASSKRRGEVGKCLSRQSACLPCSEPQHCINEVCVSGAHAYNLSTQEVQAEGSEI